MPDLKLIALDTEDLSVVSAHLQDAVLRVGDMAYLPKQKRFAALANRFDWGRALAASASFGKSPGTSSKRSERLERRRTGLRIERVLSAKFSGFELGDRRATLALLALTFEPSGIAQSPDGDVTLTFSGGAAIRLKVECLELEIRDLGAAWSTKRSPVHPDDNN